MSSSSSRCGRLASLVRLLASALCLIGATVMVAGCAGAPASSLPTGLSGEVRQAERIRVAVVGDSNSTGFFGTLEAGVSARRAWVALLPRESFEWAGGWARDGATSADMVRNVATIPNADVVVILAGTNDLASGSTAALEANLVTIVGRVGVAQVVTTAIPPLDTDPVAAVALNDQLAAMAVRHGWAFIDPWIALRAPDGRWIAAYRTDGVHTSPAGYMAMAASVSIGLLKVVGRT